MPTWQHTDLSTSSIPLVTPEALDGRVLDVRQRDEYLAGHVPGVRNVELGALGATMIEPGPVTVMCAHGERGVTGASLLERAGHHDVKVLHGGPEDWAAATKREL